MRDWHPSDLACNQVRIEGSMRDWHPSDLVMRLE